MMQRIRYFLLPLLALCALPAMAQIGVYAEFSAAKVNVPNTNWIYGPTFGAYYDPWHVPFLAAGLDARGVILGSGSNTLDSGLFGPRLVFQPHVVPLQPYVEGLVGVGHAQFGQGVAAVDATKFEYQFLGGLDMTVFPRFDWRVVEFSYGGLSGLGTSYNPKTISTGLVFRLP